MNTVLRACEKRLNPSCERRGLEALIGIDNGRAPEGVFLRVVFAVVLDGANALFHGLDDGIDGGIFALGVDENDRAADGADGVLQEGGVAGGGRVAC